MIIKPFCSTEIRFTNIKEFMNVFNSFDKSNVVLIMSKSSAYRWNFISFIDQLKVKYEKYDGSLTWINEINANPTQKDILASLQSIGNKRVDLIVACGGGSCIDLAKAVSAFNDCTKNTSYTIDEITKAIKNKEYKGKKFVDIIAVPSTAGTGSEVTQWATIWDENKEAKFSIDDINLKPKMAFIIPELTLTAPIDMTLSTGLDAICQAIEAYWSKHTNPIVQEISYRAVELIIQNLRKAVENPENIIIRENLCKASVLAGLAFSQTRTTACHSISYPLTMMYGISHGFAAAITLDAVGKKNRGKFPNDEQLFQLFSDYQGILNWIDVTCEGIINLRLSSFGIKEEDIPVIASNAFTGGRMDNNPVDLSIDDVIEILKSIL